ncbi:MAG: phosphate ABC transporter permease PstA [Holophagaceae bacterium]|nr:phosphate ABC transporter permease PstA [Holophagaceae bacterium]
MARNGTSLPSGLQRGREFLRRGSAFVWLSAAALALSLLMITGLVGFIAVKGLGFFWPRALVQATTPEGPLLGEISAREAALGEEPAKVQFRVANRDLYGQDFRWIKVAELGAQQRPADAVLVERLENGAFIGFVASVSENGRVLASGDAAFEEALGRLPEAQSLQGDIRTIEKDEVGTLNRRLEDLRLRRRGLAPADATALARLEAEEKALRVRYEALQTRLDGLRAKSAELQIILRTVDGQTKEIPLSAVVRLVAPNRTGILGKAGIYAARLWEFVSGDPRESNTEGGIFPAIFGTVLMVLIMSLMVVPLGVVTALFLREYARDGWLVRSVRVAVNNLAGVPSIVFGVFGLGFFVYTMGGAIDQAFFADRLPTPTYGTGGILWASLTLALLTVPVVVVATEEALSSVPRSLREASLALGATKWQTIWKVVLPGAAPGILTGLILAMARGAGEVAPLMLTGVVKLAPAMPLDGQFPYFHFDRKFMHLGFHIYDVGFQSPNSEAAKPMVYMTALLLLLVVVALNLFALRLRRRLRERLGGSTF